MTAMQWQEEYVRVATAYKNNPRENSEARDARAANLARIEAGLKAAASAEGTTVAAVRDAYWSKEDPKVVEINQAYWSAWDQKEASR